MFDTWAAFNQQANNILQSVSTLLFTAHDMFKEDFWSFGGDFKKELDFWLDDRVQLYELYKICKACVCALS